MKTRKIFLALLFFSSHFIFSQDLKPEYQKFIKNFIDNIKNDNKEAVAAIISFPLGREYPIPVIKNKTDFLKRYDAIFDETLKNKIIKSNPAKDWTQMGWHGIMLNQGDIWFDESGKLITINYQSKTELVLKNKLIAAEKDKLHPSIAKFKKPVYILETSKFRIRIDDLGNDNYRYASWPVKKPMSEKPDLVIINGKWIAEGSGGNSKFDFKKDDYLYECYIIVLGTSESPPATLTIYQNDKEILSQDAKIIIK
jgi:hypothetical protein